MQTLPRHALLDRTPSLCALLVFTLAGLTTAAPASAQRLDASDGRFLHRIELAWPDFAPGDAYVVTRDGHALGSVASGTTRFADSAPVAGVIHTYCVTADVPAPAPQLCDDGSLGTVTATDGLLEDRVEIRWPGPDSEETIFRVYRASEGQAVDRATDLIGLGASNETLFTDRAGDPGVLYTYCVTASLNGDLVCDTGRRILFAPTGFRASDATYENRIALTWADRSGIEDGYRLARAAQGVLAFDGASDHLTTQVAVDLSGSFTFTFRVRRTRTGAETVLSQGGGPASGLTIGFDASDRVRVGFGANMLLSATPLTDTDWHHIAVTHDAATGDRALYVDGVLAGSDVAGGPYTGLGPLVFGTRAWDAGESFGGELDEVRQWKRALPASEAIPNTLLSGQETGLVSYWPFDTGTGTTALDVTGGNDAVFEGGMDTSAWQAAPAFDLIALLPANASTFQDQTTVAGLPYTYRVEAFEYAAGSSTDYFVSVGATVAGTRGFVLPPRLFAATDGQYPDRVVLTWIDQTDAETGYRITRDGVVILPDAQTETFARNTTVRFEDTGATPGVAHTYCATTLSLLGDSPAVCDTGGIGILPAPTTVAASDDTFDDLVEITWVDDSTTEDGFRVYRDGTLVTTTTANATSYRDRTGFAGVPYTYCVAALSTVSGGEIESAQVCDTGRRIPVLAPTNVIASDGAHEDHVEIAWGNPSQVGTLFVVERSTGGGAASPIKSLPANQRLYFDAEIASETVYTYCVLTMAVIAAPSASSAPNRASDAALEAFPADEALLAEMRAAVLESPPPAFQALSEDERALRVSALTMADFAQSDRTCDTGFRTLLPPTDVAATFEDKEDYVEITWEIASSVADGHNVYRDGVLVGQVDGDRTALRDTAGTPGQTFTYTVRAFDDKGESAPSAGKTGKRTLLAPIDLAASDGAFEDRVTLTWTDESRVERGYRVYREHADGTGRVLLGTAPARAQTYIDSTASLVSGTVYTYRVAAFDGAGESAAATDAGSTALLQALSVSASTTYFDRITVTWVDVSATESGYEVTRRRRSASTIDKTETLAAGSTQFIDTDAALLLDADYVYCVRSFTTDGGARAYGANVCSTGRRDSSAEPIGEVTNPPQVVTVAGTRFLGEAVAASGADDILATGGGNAARFFSKNNVGTWTLAQAVLPTDFLSGVGLASVGVGIEGDCAAVGAPTYEDGAVAFYRRTNGTWVYRDFAEPGDGAFEREASWGAAVALGGGRGIMGAPDYNDNDNDRGRAGAAQFGLRNADCSFSGPVWDARDDVLELTENDFFGTAVDLDATYAVVGAPSARNGLGDAYIFNGNTLEAKDMLPFNFTGTTGSFGRAVGLQGGYAAIGASNAVFLFRRNDDGTWVQVARLVPPVLTAGDDFGASLAFVDNHLIIGAPGYNNGEGAAYVWQRDTDLDAWFYSHLLTVDGAGIAVQGNAGDRFGASVAIAEGWFVVGAPNDDDAGADAGALFTFPFTFIPPPPPSSIVPPGTLTASDGLAQDAIQLRWNDTSTDETGFNIYRSDQGGSIATVEPNQEAYRDFTAVPGRAYRYCIEVQTPGGVSEQVCDVGRRPSNGTISGRIVARSGSGVGGSEVCIAPSPNDALLLDGVGGFVEIPNRPAFNFDTADDFTIEVWLKYSGTAGPSGPAQASILEMGDNRGTAIPFALRTGLRSDPGKLVLLREGGGIIRSVGSTRNDLNDNTWHHVAVVHDGAAKSFTMYIDGAQDATATYTTLGSTKNAYPLYFGRRGNLATSWYGGQMDEVRIWNEARTAADIQATMRMPLAGSEDGLVGYWPLELRSGDLIVDLTPNASYGTRKGGAFSSADGAPLDTCAPTDEEGNYTLNRISYGVSTDFQVTPMQQDRAFEPVFKSITLSTENAVQNEVIFTDITAVTLAGTVVYPSPFDASTCPVPDVALYVGKPGEERLPRTSTEQDGAFSLNLDLGQYVAEPRYGEGAAEHTFSPASATVNLSGDVTLAPFEDRTVRTLSGFFGGSCDTQVGTAALRIFTEDGCFDHEVPLAGAFTVDLPAQQYLLQVKKVNPTNDDLRVDILNFFEDYGTRAVDLRTDDQSIDFIYRAPLQVAIEGLAGDLCPANVITEVDEDGTPLRTLPKVPLIPPDAVRPLTIRVTEDYGVAGTCPVDTGSVTIYDGLADRAEEPVTLAITGGTVSYETRAGQPDFSTGRVIDGVDRSYQKSLTVIARVEGRTPTTETQWAVVEGLKARQSTFVSATTEEFPVLILRDPPGSNSYSYLEGGTTHCQSWSNTQLRGGGAGADIDLRLGFITNTGVGFGVFTILAAGAGVSFKTRIVGGQDVTRLRPGERNLEICATTTERWSTPSDPTWVGEDLFAGIALNLIFALADEISSDAQSCSIQAKEVLAMDLDETEPFETTYVFGKSHITYSLIPALEQLIALSGAEASFGDTDAVTLGHARDNWKGHLALNDSLVAEALQNPVQNRSFSAGADYEYSMTADTTTVTNATTTRVYLDSQGGIGVLQNIFGFDSWNGLVYEARSERVTEEKASEDTTNVMGYVLSDGDTGDFFSVDIGTDPLYSTPVFRTVSGRSSNPWESGTQQRDKPRVEINPPQIFGADPDAGASFALTITNDSESAERREYKIRVPGEVNAKNLGVTITGDLLGGDRLETVVLNAGASVTLNMDVYPAPSAFTYEDVGIMVYPDNEFEIWRADPRQPFALSDTAFFSVSFTAPCSEINVREPGDHWTLNAATFPGGLLVSLDEFGLDVSPDERVDRLGLEYRRAGTDDPWAEAFSVGADDLPTEDATFYTQTWDVARAGLTGGAYELRGYTECPVGGRVYSPAISGVVDTVAPVVFRADPADEVLSLGDDIALTFNEPIDCPAVLGKVGSTPTNQTVFLYHDDGPAAGTEIASQALCNGSTVLVQLADVTKWPSLEGRRLRAEVRSLTDAAGNPMMATENLPDGTPHAWTFTVQRSAVAWTPSNAEANVPPAQAAALTATLANGRAQAIDFTLEGPFKLAKLDAGGVSTGDSVAVTPSLVEGRIVPGGQQRIDFGWPGAADLGTYRATLATATKEGTRELGTVPLDLTVNVTCAPPLWTLRPETFEFNMTAMARLMIDGVASQDENDRVAAFVDGHLRGLGSVTAFPGAGGTSDYLAPLLIYSNQEAGEAVTIQVWDDSACRLYTETSAAFVFVADAERGTPARPFTVFAPDNGSGPGQVNLLAGWTWISTNRTPADTSLNAVLDGLFVSNGDLVKNQTSFALYDENAGWVGSLEGIVPGPAYLTRLTASNTLVLAGTPVDVAATPIRLNAGWTWVGYLPQTAYPLDYALQNVTTQTDDLIKGQFGFAQYLDGTGWIGSLAELRPDAGYMMKMQAPTTFTYPSVDPPASASATARASVPAGDAVTAETSGSESAAQQADVPDWTVDAAQYEHSMSITATLSVDGVPVITPGSMAAAFVPGEQGGAEVRGVGSVQYVAALDEWLVFLTAYSNAAEGEALSFKLYDAASDATREAALALSFVANGVVGTLTNPIVFDPSRATAVEAGMGIPADYVILPNLPNPFASSTVLRYGLPEATRVRLVVYDVLGREVRRVVDREQAPGYHRVGLEAEDLASGVYFVRLEAGGRTETQRVVVLK